jgi:hypothetical protein
MTERRLAFDRALATATSADDAWRALHELSQAVVGHTLFTVMTVDMAAGLARRAYTDHPQDYPVSGTKPIQPNRWFDIVHGEKRSFVANTIEEIAEVFPDHALIASLGCGSVLNLPVVMDGELAATINMLHEAHWYTPDRVASAERDLAEPALRCCRLARQLSAAEDAKG